jgi:adenylate kinase
LNEPTCFVIFGPQGSGKGTQCLKLQEKYTIPYFEMGAILREARKSNFDIAEILDAGLLVPDKIVEELVSTFVYSNSNHCFLIDGFPRNCQQATFLSTLLTGLDIPVIIIELKSYDENVLVQRMLERGRSDDSMDAITKRISIYNADTVLAIEQFGYQVKSTVNSFNCDQEIDQLFDEISSVIEEALLPY